MGDILAIQGEFRIAASREVVWQALNDPEVLKACIPGCQELTRQSDSQIDAKITAQFGPVRSQFAARITLSDIDPPSGYTLSGEGKSVVGFGRGSATVRLSDAGADTILRYDAQMSLGGKLAQVGSRLVEAATRSYAEQFFDAFAKCLDPAAARVEVAELGDAESADEKPARRWWQMGGLS